MVRVWFGLTMSSAEEPRLDFLTADSVDLEIITVIIQMMLEYLAPAQAAHKETSDFKEEIPLLGA